MHGNYGTIKQALFTVSIKFVINLIIPVIQFYNACSVEYVHGQN